MSKFVRLKDAESMFSDFPNSDFTVTRDEVKLLPEPHSLRITDWLNAGGLVIVDSPEGDPLEPGDEASVDVLSDVDVPEESVEAEAVTPEPEGEAEGSEPEPVVKEEPTKTVKRRGRPRKKA
jgi:hypothetical protein